MTRISKFALITFILLSVGHARQAQGDAGKNPIIRICVADDRDSLAISLKGKYKICAPGSDKVLSEGPFLNARASSSGNALKIGDKVLGVPAIRITVARDSNIYIDLTGTSYGNYYPVSIIQSTPQE